MSNTNGTVTIQQQEYDILKALEVQNAQLRQQVGDLEGQVRLLRHRLFGASSECRTKVSSTRTVCSFRSLTKPR
nr:hypothetical protein [Alicyclobacillus hesperidum]